MTIVDVFRTAMLSAAMLSAALVNAPAALAWVQVCNGRSDTVMTAVALGDKGASGTSQSHPGVTVEGWWKLAPGACATVSEADASQNWLYFHATSKSGRLEGKSRLCVR